MKRRPKRCNNLTLCYIAEVLMIKILVALMISVASVEAIADPVVQQPKDAKYLTYQYSDRVVIVISAIPCLLKDMSAEYPFSAAAFRNDGDRRGGCFKRLDEDTIEIEWYGGEKIPVPANAFLIGPVKAEPPPPEPTL
jgi:hypothetical protein